MAGETLRPTVLTVRGSRKRLRWLGAAAALAFRSFIVLYKTFDPDQPRDDLGRWTDAGTSDEPEHTGSTVVVGKARTGNPKVDSVTEILERKVQDAMERAGPGFGPQFGTKVHGYFAQSVIEADLPGIRGYGVEVSLMGGELSPYGADGSIRTDVLMREGDSPNGRVVAIWDLKTGKAILSPSRADELRLESGATSAVPVIQLHSIWGSAFKMLPLLDGWSRVRHVSNERSTL